MDVDLSRLRRGELIVGAGGAVLLVSIFLLEWYRLSVPASQPSGSHAFTTIDGWHALTGGRWLLLLTILAALGLVFVQATRPAPALPVSAAVLVTILASLGTVWLIYRVLISFPGAREAGAIVGLVSCCVIVYGGYRSMRDEGVAASDAPRKIAVARPGEEAGN